MLRCEIHVLVWVSLLSISTPAVADEAEAVKKFVFTAQRAGFERGDLDGYMKQWADDARIVIGRAETPGEYDLVINRKQIEATRRIRFSALPVGGFEVKYEDASVKIDGDKAVLRAVTFARFQGGYEKDMEIYRLRRVANGWKVYENRAWPLESKSGDAVTRYNPTTWKALDKNVAKVKEDDDVSKLAPSLQAAWRFTEAHRAAGKLTARPNASAEAWLTRGWLALNAGDADDASKAFKTALKLDPKANVPKFIRPE